MMLTVILSFKLLVDHTVLWAFLESSSRDRIKMERIFVGHFVSAILMAAIVAELFKNHMWLASNDGRPAGF